MILTSMDLSYVHLPWDFNSGVKIRIQGMREILLATVDNEDSPGRNTTVFDTLGI
jgi:hypothetical protein